MGESSLLPVVTLLVMEVGLGLWKEASNRMVACYNFMIAQRRDQVVGCISTAGYPSFSGSVEFHTCKSMGKTSYSNAWRGHGIDNFTLPGGGGVQVEAGEFYQNGGNISFANCYAAGIGGGLSVHRGNFQQKGGFLQFHDCEASSSGGGLHVRGKVFQFRGVLKLSRCKSNEGGGVLVDGEFHQQFGTISFVSCTACRFGGGLLVQEGGSIIQQKGGILQFDECHASEGGGIHITGSSFNGRARLLVGLESLMRFTKCKSFPATTTDWTEEGGGGLFLEEGDLHVYGKLEFTDCAAETRGGGMLLKRSNLTSHGTVKFERCRAKDGGGVSLKSGQIVQAYGLMTFLDCKGRVVLDRFAVGDSLILYFCCVVCCSSLVLVCSTSYVFVDIARSICWSRKVVAAA